MWIAKVPVGCENEDRDWEWTSKFERVCGSTSTCEVDSHRLQLVELVVAVPTCIGNTNLQTYQFSSPETVAIAKILYEKFKNKIDQLPNIPWADSFTYCTEHGEYLVLIKTVLVFKSWFLDNACFISEDEGSPQGTIHYECWCLWCPTLPLSVTQPSKLIQHMALHILHDLALKYVVNPCGFCLDTGNLYSIRLVKGQGRKGAKVVNIQNSCCRNVAKLSVNSATKSTMTNPCTNYPIECPYCH